MGGADSCVRRYRLGCVAPVGTLLQLPSLRPCACTHGLCADTVRAVVAVPAPNRVHVLSGTVSSLPGSAWLKLALGCFKTRTATVRHRGTSLVVPAFAWGLQAWGASLTRNPMCSCSYLAGARAAAGVGFLHLLRSGERGHGRAEPHAPRRRLTRTRCALHCPPPCCSPHATCSTGSGRQAARA